MCECEGSVPEGHVVAGYVMAIPYPERDGATAERWGKVFPSVPILVLEGMEPFKPQPVFAPVSNG